jgi:two-component system cell cycle response regulator
MSVVAGLQMSAKEMAQLTTPGQAALDPVVEEHEAPLNVLVVDDDAISRHAIERAVEALGHRCRSAKNGVEAWAMYEAERADVILSDWDMPGMDGVELCRRVRQAGQASAYTYFIFLTGFDDREHFLRGMRAGADDYHTRPVDIEELQARLVSAGRVVQLYRRLAESNSALRRDSQTWFRLARLDALTGIPNRFSMNTELESLWARSRRYARPVAMALCDIDRFKAYNDRFGHIAGDEALRQIAAALRTGLRQCDSLYRYGGEEFLVVLPEQPLPDAARVMERVRGAVEKLALPAAAGGPVTISVGVTGIDQARDHGLEDWLRRTDAELYLAKREGGNRVSSS